MPSNQIHISEIFNLIVWLFLSKIIFLLIFSSFLSFPAVLNFYTRSQILKKSKKNVRRNGSQFACPLILSPRTFYVTYSVKILRETWLSLMRMGISGKTHHFSHMPHLDQWSLKRWRLSLNMDLKWTISERAWCHQYYLF